MYKDEIISEVWANRESYVESHQHNLGAMIADLKKRQQKSGAVVVDRRNLMKEQIVVPNS